MLISVVYLYSDNNNIKTEIMTTTKTHLGMAMGQGKITLHKSACGLGVFNHQGRWNYIVKTSEFKMLHTERGEELVCLKCLAKAKEQGRV